MKLFATVVFTFLISYYSFANQNHDQYKLSNNDSLSIKETTSSIVAMKEIDLIIKTEYINIGGTLTIPFQQKTNSLVIMSSGSGPQDRDETLDGFKIFKVISNHLASEGIASFRYDDRGVGKSTGNFNNSTLKDLSDDIIKIIDFFKSNQQHSFQDFILFGHSLGGIVVGNAALDNKDVKQVILMASPSVPLSEVILYQVRQEYDSMDIDKSLIEAEVSAHNRMMKAIKNDENLDQIVKDFKESNQAVLESHPAYIGNSKSETIAIEKANEMKVVYALPIIESFLYHNPSDDYEQLQVPVLALFGGKDIQITINQNKDRMENAFLNSKTKAHFITLNDANHYFQEAKTGQRDEYEKLNKAFIDGFLKEISTWILSN